MAVSRRSVLLGLGTWAAVGGHTLWRHSSGPRGPVRVVSWNLRNFSGATTPTSRHAPGHDLERLAGHFAAFDADVFCFQEVLDPSQLPALLPGYTLQASGTGGAHGQQLVIARRASIVAEPAVTDPCTVLDPALRPTLVQPLWLEDQRWSIAVVHLKATPAGHSIRAAQRGPLLRMLDALPRPRLVVGDFNTTGARTGSPAREITSVCREFESVGLHRVQPTLPCTAYWEGGRFDRFSEPSVLDHVFTEGAAPAAPAVQVAPGLQCSRSSCKPLTSTPAYPDLDLERVSDHCPLLIDISG